MTPEAMREIRNRLDGITKGDWKPDVFEYPLGDTGDYDTTANINSHNGDKRETIASCYEMNNGGIEIQESNAKFIAHAPAVIRALLDAFAERDALLGKSRRFLEDADYLKVVDVKMAEKLCKRIDALKEGR